jgi:hypothetical protein
MCPYAFKLKYLDRRIPEKNYVFEYGKKRHDFFYNFFDMIFISNNQEYLTSFIDKIHLTNNDSRNFIDFQKKRYEEISAKKSDWKRYFYPSLREELITCHNNKIRGQPDAFYIDHDTEELNVWEYKTGKPTADKVLGYVKDGVWYKLLAKKVLNQDIANLIVYFSYNNYNKKINITDKQTEILLSEIIKTRENIIRDMSNDSPTKNSFAVTKKKGDCNWCGFKETCQYCLL